MSLKIFGFQALWSPYFILILIIFAILYFLITIKARSYFKMSATLKKSEVTYFLLLIFMIYIIKGSPLDLMAHIMFTVHMIQMAVLILWLPILLIKGIPWWVWNAVIEAPIVNKIFKILTNPMVATFVFIGTFSFYHIPFIMDYIKLNNLLHSLSTIVLFLSAFFMYWNLFEVIPGRKGIQPLYKIGYIILNTILITPACALIIFSPTPLYETYTNGEAWLKVMELCVPTTTLSGIALSGPELFTNMKPIFDQQLGGVLMKILQEIIFGILVGKIARGWYRLEKANSHKITTEALIEFQNNKLG